MHAMMMMMAWSPSIVPYLLAAATVSVAAAVEVIQVGAVTIQLCTPHIVRVQAAAPPAPPEPPDAKEDEAADEAADGARAGMASRLPAPW